jgi:hypothetical protein
MTASVTPALVVDAVIDAFPVLSQSTVTTPEDDTVAKAVEEDLKL